MNHYVAPFANKNRLTFENQFTKYNVNFKDIHLEINKGTLVSYRQFIEILLPLEDYGLKTGKKIVKVNGSLKVICK